MTDQMAVTEDRRPGTRLANRPASVTRPRRAGRNLLWLAVMALLASSCVLARPEGAAPLRYRDAIFTTVTKTSDIVYGSAVGQQGNTVTLTLDVYRPQGDQVTSRPLMIWVHGGSFAAGDKTSPELVDEATTFAQKGYVTASINYRLATNGCRTVSAECVQAIYDANTDAQDAVRFFRAHAATYGVDPARIGIGGSSAGAITALDVGYRVESPGATPPSALSEVRAAVSLSGAAIFTGSEGPGDAPALLFHGTADPLVPYSWAVSTVDAAHQAGLEAYLITWDGDGHVPYAQHRQQILDLTTNFLYYKLDAGNAAR